MTADKAAKPMTSRQYKALADFRYELRRFLRYSEQVTRKEGLTPLQYQLMLQLKGYPGREWATVGELAERLQSQHHGVVALVSRCAAQGWVSRQQSTTDRREVEVHLTAEGQRMVDGVARLHREELLNLEGAFEVPRIQDLLAD